ncbi:3-hydroxyacyl-CoA dehydrogenase family protein [Alcaligenaceae bacterium]|nr:3-hydroxyacyl-CoA dehydrogenase family protein [Alcaligenaceae bacterium]
MNISHIAVLGAGIMGANIALHFARHGLAVTLHDPSSSVRDGLKSRLEDTLSILSDLGMVDAKDHVSILNRLTICDRWEAAVESADFIMEAAPEALELKQKIFADLAKVARKEAILATNTSTLELSRIIAGLDVDRAGRSMVCHWYNPAHLIPLVELSDYGNLQADVLPAVEALFKKTGNQTIRVKKEVPGLVANRIQQGLAREVFALMNSGIASAEDIDRAVRYGPAFRYAAAGQLEIADFGGLDIWKLAGDSLLPEIDASQSASSLLAEKVQAGMLGTKSGEGFFKYDDHGQAATRSFHRRLSIQLKASQEMSEED